jgi:ATP/maltotriose-dependent transcriptional regulator MalT
MDTRDLVQPKLAFPRFPPGLVVRRRLLDLLSAGVEQRVKLGVTRGRDAVDRARDLGLL